MYLLMKVQSGWQFMLTEVLLEMLIWLHSFGTWVFWQMHMVAPTSYTILVWNQNGFRRKVRATEIFATTHAFDFASTLHRTTSNLFDLVIPVVINTDSKPLFDSVVGLILTTEKWMLIDLFILRQSYELRELTKIVWIPSAQNPAIAVTIQSASNALMHILQTNKVLWMEKYGLKEVW